MTNPNELCKQAGKKVFKKVLKKILPVPGAGLALKAVSALDEALDMHNQEKLADVRRLEKKMGSHSSEDIGSVWAALESCVKAAGPLSMEAVARVSEYNVCAWEAPNKIWVFHKYPKYRPCYRLKGAKIFRPTGRPQKDGTYLVEEVPQ